MLELLSLALRTSSLHDTIQQHNTSTYTLSNIKLQTTCTVLSSARKTLIEMTTWPSFRRKW